MTTNLFTLDIVCLCVLSCALTCSFIAWAFVPRLSPFNCLLYCAFTCLMSISNGLQKSCTLPTAHDPTPFSSLGEKLGSSFLPSVNVLLVLAHVIKHIMKHCPSKKNGSRLEPATKWENIIIIFLTTKGKQFFVCSINMLPQ